MARTNRSADTKQLGLNAEQMAFDFLRRNGLKPVRRNFRSRRGEIDLIMLDKACLVFVEVRFRTNKSFVEAILTVDSRKQRKLISTASIFLSRNESFGSHVCRFDVIGIDRDSAGEDSIKWVQDAFRP